MNIRCAFADIRVAPPTGPAYFVEVKYGFSKEMLQRHLRRKFGPESRASTWGSKVILVSDLNSCSDYRHEFTDSLAPDLKLEIWEKQHLLAKMAACFKTDYSSISAENLHDVRESIDRAKGFCAFGGSSLQEYSHDPLKAALLWHFGFWRLRQLREAGRANPRDILPPGTYKGVAVVLADLCSFSSFVRDTPDNEIVRESLTSFYSKARYQIINNGGMLLQFVGDEVIGCFGLPESGGDFASRAFETAKALACIGDSVANRWQRRIDRVQASGGVHVGIAVGDLQMVSMRPYSRTHMGAIGDCINVAARLMNTATQGQIAVSNSFHQLLPDDAQAAFQEMEPVEARNVGRIKAWRYSSASARSAPAPS